MAWSGPQARSRGAAFRRVLRGVEWLRARRDLVIALAVAGIAVSFILDLVIPGYAIAGFYLVPLLLVAFTMRGRRAVVIVSVVCLGLTVCAMVLQGRADAQNILLVWFGALAGAGLIALGYLYNRFDDLYQAERSTTGRLHSLTAQLQRLQEVSVLDSDRPLSELLLDIVVQARQFLGSDGARLFRLEAADGLLSTQATIGLRPPSDGRRCRGAAASAAGPSGRAVAARGGRRRSADAARRPATGPTRGRPRGLLGLPGLPGGAPGRARRRVRRDRALLPQGHDVRRQRGRSGVVVRRPGRPRHRERAAARADGAQRRGRRALAPGS